MEPKYVLLLAYTLPYLLNKINNIICLSSIGYYKYGGLGVFNQTSGSYRNWKLSRSSKILVLRSPLKWIWLQQIFLMYHWICLLTVAKFPNKTRQTELRCCTKLSDYLWKLRDNNTTQYKINWKLLYNTKTSNNHLSLCM